MLEISFVASSPNESRNRQLIRTQRVMQNPLARSRSNVGCARGRLRLADPAGQELCGREAIGLLPELPQIFFEVVGRDQGLIELPGLPADDGVLPSYRRGSRDSSRAASGALENLLVQTVGGFPVQLPPQAENFSFKSFIRIPVHPTNAYLS
jgi:hypothetical protein